MTSGTSHSPCCLIRPHRCCFYSPRSQFGCRVVSNFRSGTQSSSCQASLRSLVLVDFSRQWVVFVCFDHIIWPLSRVIRREKLPETGHKPSTTGCCIVSAELTECCIDGINQSVSLSIPPRCMFHYPGTRRPPTMIIWGRLKTQIRLLCSSKQLPIR